MSLNESCFITYVEYTRKLFHLSAFLLTRSGTCSGTRNNGVGRVYIYIYTYIYNPSFVWGKRRESWHDSCQQTPDKNLKVFYFFISLKGMMGMGGVDTQHCRHKRLPVRIPVGHDCCCCCDARCPCRLCWWREHGFVLLRVGWLVVAGVRVVAGVSVYSLTSPARCAACRYASFCLSPAGAD